MAPFVTAEKRLAGVHRTDECGHCRKIAARNRPDSGTGRRPFADKTLAGHMTV
jgi:hypothetical protein